MGNNIQGNNKYAYLNHLSTSELEKLLRSDLDSLENRDPDRTLYILEVIEQRDPESAAKRQAEAGRAWKEFLELYDAPEGEGLTLYSSEVENDKVTEEKCIAPTVVPHKKHRQLRRFLLIAAVIACLIATLLPTALGDNGFFDRIGVWSDEHFSFSKDGSEVNIPNKELEGLQTALSEHGITELVVPRYLPEGYKCISLEVTPMPDFGFTFFNAVYQQNESALLSISIQKNNTLVSSVYEKSENEPEIYEQEGIKHYLFSNLENNCIVWNNGKLECSIQGNVAIEEIRKMIDSIYER